MQIEGRFSKNLYFSQKTFEKMTKEKTVIPLYTIQKLIL